MRNEKSLPEKTEYTKRDAVKNPAHIRIFLFKA